jgi:hypothetical protein
MAENPPAARILLHDCAVVNPWPDGVPACRAWLSLTPASSVKYTIAPRADERKSRYREHIKNNTKMQFFSESVDRTPLVRAFTLVSAAHERSLRQPGSPSERKGRDH